jgi:hypothetical protein
MNKFPSWFRVSLVYPIVSLLALFVGKLLPQTETGFILQLLSIEINFPGALLIKLFWDFSHAYHAFWPVSLGIIFLNWVIVIIPLSWLTSKLFRKLKSFL